jgi:hypothetical protein
VVQGALEANPLNSAIANVQVEPRAANNFEDTFLINGYTMAGASVSGQVNKAELSTDMG